MLGINKIIKHFNKWCAKLECRMYGHIDPVVIERYRMGETLLKNYKGDLKNLVMTKPFRAEVYHIKTTCRACGSTFITKGYVMFL